MQIRKLLTDDDAVSPVIGVILMVAITVILAAVIGAFVLGFGGGGPSAPSVTWETSNDVDRSATTSNGTVTFRHGGGDTIDNADSVLTVNGDGLSDPGAGVYVPSTMSTGDEVLAYNGTDGTAGSPDADAIDGEYVLVWEPEDGDSSQQLATHNV